MDNSHIADSMKYLLEKGPTKSEQYMSSAADIEVELDYIHKQFTKLSERQEKLEAARSFIKPDLKVGSFAFHKVIGNCIIVGVQLADNGALFANVISPRGNKSAPYSEFMVPSDATKVLYETK